MSEPVFSTSWYRVAGLRPRLRRHARLHRHSYRGEVWYVLEDTSTGRCHRLSAAAHRLVARMDGTATVGELWDRECLVWGDEAPTQDETIRFLGQLHAADVLATDVVPDRDELLRRQDRKRRGRRLQRLLNPLAVRLPLFDPDPFLERALPLIRPLFSGWGLALWAAVVAAAALLSAAHWAELTSDLAGRVLTPQNLVLLWLAYPLVKGLHELGHGFAAKTWGAPVHEMGVMILVLIPVPYVEASATAALPEKGRRMAVGAAGIMVELFVASLALFVWLAAEPGVVRGLAWNIMLVGGISTLFFNGNPLLRYDGYYVLCDALEIPNLGTRANAYLGYLAKRRLLGATEVQVPTLAPGEPAWLVGYGIAAFIYRLFILFAIALFIGTRFFAVGVLLALWAVAAQVLWPAVRLVRYLVSSPELNRLRARALAASLALGAGLAILVGSLPVPSWTRADGVVWMAEDSRLRAATDGFVIRLLAADGDPVAPGEPLIETSDPILDQRVRVLEAQGAELQARLAAAAVLDRSALDEVRQEMTSVDADLALARERRAGLTLRSPGAGTLILPDAADLPGRFVKRGEVLGYVGQGEGTTVRVVVGQADVAEVREHLKSIEVWPAGWARGPVPVAISRQVPAATDRLPSAALGAPGGGRIAVDPADQEGRKTLQPVFELDLLLPPGSGSAYPGSRVAVRFDHGREPLAAQWYRALRRVFLSHFAV